ncbi:MULTISPECIES: hypothetical protein [Myroides]|uniref:hypothetical protein n=1 Tax=Flavobacteriales TaxID=200644 RepID=UPI002574A84B|nr:MULTISPECIES: hypothetical protein [Myroides]MDM1408562.1 hypothetical protein [Myroides sp. DF42-4-2]MDM1450870.1 hypothetical protein [Myroides odoratimimus]
MKKAALYIFLFTLVFRTFYAQFHYAFYLLDTERYIELFCENQEKPELHCNGKCSLNKASKEASETQEKIPEQISSISFPDFIPTEKFTLEFIKIKRLQKNKIIAKQSFYSFLYLDKCKYPPENLMI